MKNIVYLSILIGLVIQLAYCKPRDELEDLEDIEELLDELISETYILTYFDIRGRAEFLRFMFAAADEDFEDIRIKLADWPKLKPNYPFGQLPLLEIKRGNETFRLAQSMAIAKYLANEFDLDGKGSLESAFIEMYGEQAKDLFEAINANINNNQTSSIPTTISNNLKPFETQLKSEGTGYLVGTRLSWADLYLSSLMDYLGEKKDKILNNFPNVQALDDRVRSLPLIAKWIKERPKSDI